MEIANTNGCGPATDVAFAPNLGRCVPHRAALHTPRCVPHHSAAFHTSCRRHSFLLMRRSYNLLAFGCASGMVHVWKVTQSYVCVACAHPQRSERQLCARVHEGARGPCRGRGRPQPRHAARRVERDRVCAVVVVIRRQLRAHVATYVCGCRVFTSQRSFSVTNGRARRWARISPRACACNTQVFDHRLIIACVIT